jgi:hypothetical protein
MLLVPRDIMSRTVSTPAIGMFWLGGSDLARMGQRQRGQIKILSALPLALETLLCLQSVDESHCYSGYQWMIYSIGLNA